MHSVRITKAELLRNCNGLPPLHPSRCWSSTSSVSHSFTVVPLCVGRLHCINSIWHMTSAQLLDYWKNGTMQMKVNMEEKEHFLHGSGHMVLKRRKKVKGKT